MRRRDPLLTARLLAEAARAEPAAFYAPGPRDAVDCLVSLIDRLRTSAVLNESLSLTPQEAWLLATGFNLGLCGESFNVAFRITGSHRPKSFKPFAMAADSQWREEVLGLETKAAIAATAKLFGLKASKTAFPTAVRDARCKHAQNVETAIKHQMEHCGLSRAEALTAVRYVALRDAALCG